MKEIERDRETDKRHRQSKRDRMTKHRLRRQGNKDTYKGRDKLTDKERGTLTNKGRLPARQTIDQTVRHGKRESHSKRD